MNLEELKKLIEEINTNFNNFKTQHDREIAEVKKRGDADPITKEQVEKLQEKVTGALEKVQGMDAEQKAIRIAMSRPGFSGNAEGVTPEVKEAQEKYKAAFSKYLRSNDQQSALIDLRRVEGEVKDLVSVSDPDGGFLVRPEVNSRVIKRVFETSPLRQVANVLSIGGKSVEFMIDDDELASGGWVGETATRNTTNTPEVGKITITAMEQYAQPRASQSLLEDAGIDVEAWLGDKATDIFSRTENSAFINGDGIVKPRGILTYANWDAAGVYQRNKVEQINIGDGSAGVFTANGLIDLQNSLKEPYQVGAVWLIRRQSFGAIMKLKDAEGNYLFNRDLTGNAGKPGSILGQPVLFAADMPAIGEDALAVAYGNFGQAYQIVDRKGLTLIRDIYTDKPFVKFYMTKRTGGEVVNFEAFKIGKLSA